MDAQKWDPLLLPFAGDVLSRCDDGQLEAIAERAAILEFAGGGSLKLDVECIEASLADVGGAWETANLPDHNLT